MENKSILIVDDEPDLREALKEALTQAGFSVSVATNGSDGYKHAITYHPDLILMDINMPELDGHAAVKKLRLDPWGNKAKIIFLSANSDAANIYQAVKKGSEKYIVKNNTSLQEIVKQCRQALMS